MVVDRGGRVGPAIVRKAPALAQPVRMFSFGLLATHSVQ
jgi:hypothetical protein